MAIDKRQMLERVITGVRDIPISQIADIHLQLVQKGINKFALCPFHNDKSLGSFVVTDRKNIYKCFSCGEGGDGISLYAHMEGQTYVEAAFKIALRFGQISQIEFDEYYSKKRYSDKEVKAIAKKYHEIDKDRLKSNIADRETLDKVFKIFLSNAELTEKHKNQLINERGLSEDEISQKLYKTFPSGHMARKDSKFMKQIYGTFGSYDILSTIPGFFKEEKKNKETGEKFWAWAITKHTGLIIPIMDLDGYIVGIQIRRDDDSLVRYVWFSSSFAMFTEKYAEGTSSGAPIDVVYPKKITNKGVFITEGRFKAEKIAEKYGSIVISVQGVTTWNGLLEILKEIPTAKRTLELLGDKAKVFSIEKIMVAFDADMNFNPRVWEQAKKMSDKIQEVEYDVIYLNWDETIGKGFDDMIISNHAHLIKPYSKKDWDEAYSKVIEIAVLEENEPLHKISSDVFKKYFEKHMKIAPLVKK